MWLNAWEMDYLEEVVKFDENGTIVKLARKNQSYSRFHSTVAVFICFEDFSHVSVLFWLRKIEVGGCASILTTWYADSLCPNTGDLLQGRAFLAGDHDEKKRRREISFF